MGTDSCPRRTSPPAKLVVQEDKRRSRRSIALIFRRAIFPNNGITDASEATRTAAARRAQPLCLIVTRAVLCIPGGHPATKRPETANSPSPNSNFETTTTRQHTHWPRPVKPGHPIRAVRPRTTNRTSFQDPDTTHDVTPTPFIQFFHQYLQSLSQILVQTQINIPFSHLPLPHRSFLPT